ncbi:MAG: COG3904 family protein [Erythrobacter sp.]
MIAALGCLALLTGAGERDPDNPTCPAEPDWGSSEPMKLTTVERGNYKVLLAEGRIDAGLPARLKEAIDSDPMIGEVWLRSRGGNARAGNEAGRIIRGYPGLVTRIPAGWTCFSACNFIFMGGKPRIVDEGGIFMVHMFTHTSDRWVIDDAVIDGSEATTELIVSIEQSSALLATEDNDFLIRMGISRNLLTEVMYQQQARGTEDDPSTRYCLTPEEIYEYNVMNAS